MKQITRMLLLSFIFSTFFFVSGVSAKVLQITGGPGFNCALFDSNKVRCWGSNTSGSLGRGNTAQIPFGTFSEVDLGTKEKILELKANPVEAHACALFESGRVKCWGRSDYGQLGYESTNTRGDSAGEMGSALPFLNLNSADSTAKVVQVDAASYLTCVLFDNSKTKCWGYGGSGNHGYPNTTTLGNAANQMGGFLPYHDYGTNEKVRQIEGGYLAHCALFESGRVKCWGNNDNGQLGRGDRAQYGGSTQQPLSQLAFVDLGTEAVTQISSGYYYHCALFKSGNVKCWGLNDTGKLGYGDGNNRGDQANEMGNQLPYLNLGTTEKVTKVYAGGSHSCAIFESGRAKCWGDNSVGQLGQGDTKNRGAGANQMGDNLKFIDFGRGVKVSHLALSGNTTCAILSPIGELKCYGSNSNGQLGYSGAENRGVMADQLGDNLSYVDFGD